MPFLSPRIAPGIGVAMARVGARFYFFSILVVGSTVFLPHPVAPSRPGLAILTALAVALIVFLHLFPWDRYEPRLFTLTYTLSSAILIALLVSMTGGVQSSYGLLFFLIILFSYFYNLTEMLAITSVVTLFYLLPAVYNKIQPYQLASTAVTVLFFYLGTYVLYGVTRFVLKRNDVLEELNKELSDLHSFTSGLLSDMEKESLIDSLSESLKDHLPTTYCILMILDDKMNLVLRAACPIRALTWEPSIGAVYSADRLTSARAVLGTRQPQVFRLEVDDIDDDLRKLITRETRSVLVVPIRVVSETAGLLLFGEERCWERTPLTSEKIQLAVAISKQIGIALNMRWCYERMNEAYHNIKINQDRLIKAERLATLGEVTKAVEHEINNPLSVIVNWAEIYREDANIDPEIRKKFQTIFEMAIRIMKVIKKMSAIKEAKSIEFLKGHKMTDLE